MKTNSSDTSSGAFPGAYESKEGLFVQETEALFLDGIGNTSLALQVKLLFLRALQERELNQLVVQRVLRSM